MCIKRWGAGVAVMNGCLWVIGGMNGAERGTVPTLEVYNPGLVPLCCILLVVSLTRCGGSPLLCLLAAPWVKASIAMLRVKRDF